MATRFTLNSSFKLKSGHHIPLLGYGVFQTPPDITSSVVQEAVKCGYRHVDSAAYYHNEAAAAQGLLKSGVPREQLFYTTKIPQNTSYEVVKKQITKSIKEIGDLKYIDLMLLHSPYGGTEGRLGAWKALTEAVEAGTIRSIGVSNFGIHHLEELENYINETDAEHGKGAGGILSVNQIEIHPWLQRKDLVEWCQKRGILVEAWAPLVQGQRWGEKAIQDIVKRTGKTEAQVLLRWSLQKGLCPLPKSVTPERIAANTDIFDFELSAVEMKSLDTNEYNFHGWE